MNILIVAHVDHSGAGYALKEAINKTTEHTALAISFKRSWINYPVDIFNPKPEMFKKYVAWADVLNLHDDALKYVPNTKKKVVTTYHGTWYRSQYEQINKRDKKRGFIPTALTLDLAMKGPMWIGRAIPDLRKMHNPQPGFTVAHAPTQRHRKGTSLVVKAFQDLGANLMLIEKQTHERCLKMKAKCDVLIDQIGSKALGYGTNALEAWAMGIPVISNASFDWHCMASEVIGTSPFINASTIQDIKESVEELRDNQGYYNSWRDIGLGFVQHFHSQEYVASEFIKACK
jgi:hypothetical protein